MGLLNARDFKERLIRQALSLGFDLAGVASVDPFVRYAAYESWLEKGMHAGMAYLDTQRGRSLRRNPADVLPGAQSVLVLAARYDAPGDEAIVKETPRYGRVAAYARDVDYHDVLQEKASALVAFIIHETGGEVTAKAYTDTGPVLEREFGVRAGLGWQGKNTCLIHPALGSYFFLTEIFLDVALEADEPFTADRCGSCRRCLDACPTGCLLPGRVLDARRCLAYLTIENKGDIPADLRPALGDHVFGCDICQQVCPWNRKARKTETWIDLYDLFTLSAQDFNRRFAGSPLLRAKRRGMLRNATVVLGNQGGEESVPILDSTLDSETDDLVRSHAAWALQRIRERSNGIDFQGGSSGDISEENPVADNEDVSRRSILGMEDLHVR